MTDVTIKPTEIRSAVARVIAAHFLLHLETELKKPDEAVFEDYPNDPIREKTREWIDYIRREYAIGPEEKLPSENIFDKWCAMNGKFEYHDSGLYGYNRIFFARLLDLREGTPASQAKFFADTRKAFGNFDYEKQGYTVSFFLNSESNMRELLREAIRRNLPELGKAADAIVLKQSAAFQTEMYEYFESVLKTTLAENVRLLNGILPETVATELKRNGFVEPVQFAHTAVIFTDFESFSQSTEHLPASEVISRLDTYFTQFDHVIARYGLEKIKTIGDSYMAVAGVPEPHKDPVRAACDAALEFSRGLGPCISAKIWIGPDGWNIRIGVHSRAARRGRDRAAEIQLMTYGARRSTSPAGWNRAARRDASTSPKEIYQERRDGLPLGTARASSR